MTEYLCAQTGCERPVEASQIYCSQHRPKPDDHPFKASYSMAGVAARKEYQAAKRDGRKSNTYRGQSVALEGSYPPLPRGKVPQVCPLYKDDPQYPGHHTWESWDQGVAVQRCECGFERRIVLGGGE